MVNLLPEAYETTFMTFFFVLMRVGAAVFTMPVVGAQSVPRPVRAGFAFFITLVMMTPYFGLASTVKVNLPPSVDVYHGVVGFTLAAGSEFLIGYSLGFMFQVLIGAIGLSGEIIGKQAGFSAASVFDPITGQDNFLLAQIKVWIGTLIFLGIGGPEMVLQAVSDSFRVIGPGESIAFSQLSEAGYKTIVYDDSRHYALMSILYIVGMRIALPMVGAMLLVSLAEAFIARTAPQLNIMSVGFAIRMSMALFILFNLIPYLVGTFKPHLMLYVRYSRAFLGWLAPS